MGISTVTVTVVACGPDVSKSPLEVKQGYTNEAFVLFQTDAATYEAECLDHMPYIRHSATNPVGVVPSWLVFSPTEYTINVAPPSTTILTVFVYTLTLSYGTDPVIDVPFEVRINTDEICQGRNNWEWDPSMLTDYKLAAGKVVAFNVPTALPLDTGSPA